MEEKKQILGCFVSGPFSNYVEDEHLSKQNDEKDLMLSDQFCSYIWGYKGIWELGINPKTKVIYHFLFKY